MVPDFDVVGIGGGLTDSATAAVASPRRFHAGCVMTYEIHTSRSRTLWLR
jgi:hypothetical protein